MFIKLNLASQLLWSTKFCISIVNYMSVLLGFCRDKIPTAKDIVLVLTEYLTPRSCAFNANIAEIYFKRRKFVI